MPSTPTYGIYYPGPDDAPDGPGEIQQTAETTETALGGLLPDSGVLTSLDLTPGTGWAVDIKEHRTLGKKMFLHLQFSRSGSAINADTGNPGNIIGDPVLGTINDVTHRPVMDWFGLGRSNVTSGAVQINAADGQVKIVDIHSGSSIITGQIVQLAASYMIP